MRNGRQASRWGGEDEDDGNPDAGLPSVGSRAGSSATYWPPRLTVTGGSRQFVRAPNRQERRRDIVPERSFPADSQPLLDTNSTIRSRAGRAAGTGATRPP